MKRLSIIIMVLFSSLWLAGAAFGAIIVGRISHVEGQIYRYMAGDQSWVETFLDSPVGIQDVLTTGYASRAEISFPNHMVLRLAENAELEIVRLDEHVAVFALQQGLVRFTNRDAAATLAVETVRGTAEIGPGHAADMRVDGDVVTVSSVYGQTTFLLVENGVEKQEVITGSTRLEFHPASVVAGVGPIDRGWDSWCAERENLLNRNQLVRSEYLPETMQDYAYVLEPNGSWRRIYHRGYYYWVWQPRYVTADWAPYTTGYWYDWQDEPVWIDYNPWGWVTHHHGHWLYLNGAWVWTPYIHLAQVPGVTAIGFTLHFDRRYRSHWHPGRVRWISYHSHTGWLPLAPWETYYGKRRWGPRSVVVAGGVDFSITLNLANHRYIDHAVIVPDQHFQRRRPVGRDHYNRVRLRNLNRNIIVKSYKTTLFAADHKHRRGVRTDRQAETRQVRVRTDRKRIDGALKRPEVLPQTSYPKEGKAGAEKPGIDQSQRTISKRQPKSVEKSSEAVASRNRVSSRVAKNNEPQRINRSSRKVFRQTQENQQKVGPAPRNGAPDRLQIKSKDGAGTQKAEKVRQKTRIQRQAAIDKTRPDQTGLKQTGPVPQGRNRIPAVENNRESGKRILQLRRETTVQVRENSGPTRRNNTENLKQNRSARHIKEARQEKLRNREQQQDDQPIASRDKENRRPARGSVSTSITARAPR